MKLESININKIENGFTVRASYHGEKKKGDDVMMDYETKEYACPDAEHTANKVKMLISDFDKSMEDVVDDAFDKEGDKDNEAKGNKKENSEDY